MRRIAVRGSGLSLILILAALTQGCLTIYKVPIPELTPTGAKLQPGSQTTPISLYFSDRQSKELQANFISGRLAIFQLRQGEAAFNPIKWLTDNTAKELSAGGLPTTIVADANGAQTVAINRFHSENRRVGGYSPFETITTLSADLIGPTGTKRLAAFGFGGKLPVMTWTEVFEPTFYTPMAMVASELAAKLNQELFGWSLPDEEVEKIIARTRVVEVKIRDIFGLAFSNNPKAIPGLVRLARASDKEISRSAILGLGILKATEQFDLMVAAYQKKSESWEDRIVGLKAIGDLGTPSAKAFLDKERARLKGQSDPESLLTNSVIELYYLGWF